MGVLSASRSLVDAALPAAPAATGAALALALLLGAAPREAAACSVCLAGDPVFSTHGASSQEAGSFSLYLETRGFRKTSGSHAHDDPDPEHGEESGQEESVGEAAHARAARGSLRPRHAGQAHEPAAAAEGGDEHAEDHDEPGHDDGRESSRGQRLDLFASWTPLDRWTLSLDLPFAWNRIVEESEDERTRSTLSGLGDVSLGSSFVIWRDRGVLPSTWLEGRLWLKTPTGRDEAKVDGTRNPHLQPGTGSWDFGAGLAAVHRTSWGSLYGSVFYRENTPGSLDYTYGDVWLANAAVEVPVGHALSQPALDWLTAGLELNFRYAGYDHEDGERFEDSGGAILYATPSVRVRLPWGIGESGASVRAAVQIPLSQTWLHNTQREKEVWSLGLLVPF